MKPKTRRWYYPFAEIKTSLCLRPDWLGVSSWYIRRAPRPGCHMSSTLSHGDHIHSRFHLTRFLCPKRMQCDSTISPCQRLRVFHRLTLSIPVVSVFFTLVLHVVFGKPIFLLPSGVHVSAIRHRCAPSLSVHGWPTQFHVLLLIVIIL